MQNIWLQGSYFAEQDLTHSIKTISLSSRLTYLIVHCIELVVEAHCKVCACIRSHMCCEWALYLINCIVHINSSFADLHILKTGLHTEREWMKEILDIPYQYILYMCHYKQCIEEKEGIDIALRTLFYMCIYMPLAL